MCHAPLLQVMVVVIMLLMFSLNVLFIIDLTLNHDAHSEFLFDVLSLVCMECFDLYI